MNIKYTFVALCAGFFMFLSACDKTPTTPQFKLVETSRDSVKAKLDENFIINDCGRVTHLEYFYPTKEWIEQKFVPYWFEYRKRNKLMYDIDATNCESFAFQAHFASQELEGKNVAFGVFFYVPDKNDKRNIGHAINILLINNGDNIIIKFFEPQTSKFVTLSSTEITSCAFYYF